MVLLISNARCVVTDSGGLQKEAFTLGVPCTTLRTETEWVETLGDGWNLLAADAVDLAQAVLRDKPSRDRVGYFGEGAAAPAVVAALSL